jgi:hypothetical protein
MKTLTLITFEKTRLTLNVVAAWYAPEVVASLAEEQAKPQHGVIYVIEANGLTRIFPDLDHNQKALKFVLLPPFAQAERERKKLEDHLGTLKT